MSQGPVIKLSVGDNFTIALLASGEMYGWGANENGQMKLDSSYLAEPTPIKVWKEWFLTNI
jgi:alpha-tubulin suppressor-like RCC1 family protein